MVASNRVVVIELCFRSDGVCVVESVLYAQMCDAMPVGKEDCRCSIGDIAMCGRTETISCLCAHVCWSCATWTG